MTDTVVNLLEPFVQRGLFANSEEAAAEMARVYILRQIQGHQTVIDRLEAKYGMSYEQFEAYLQARSQTLADAPNPELNQAIMAEEEDALDWKIAREMLSSWLGLQTEVRL